MGNTIGPGSSFDVETLIIGGGPTGLGAAYRYFKHGFEDFTSSLLKDWLIKYFCIGIFLENFCSEKFKVDRSLNLT